MSYRPRYDKLMRYNNEMQMNEKEKQENNTKSLFLIIATLLLHSTHTIRKYLHTSYNL